MSEHIELIVASHESEWGDYELHRRGCAHLERSGWEVHYSPEGDSVDEARLNFAAENDGCWIVKAAGCALGARRGVRYDVPDLDEMPCGMSREERKEWVAANWMAAR